MRAAALEKGIFSASELCRRLVATGATVALSTVGRWWGGARRPSIAAHYDALDKVLEIEDSEQLFLLRTKGTNNK